MPEIRAVPRRSHRWVYVGVAACLLAAVAVVAALGLAAREAPVSTGHLDVRHLPAPSVPEDDLLAWAELVLAGECMAEHGFEFTVDWVVEPAAADPERNPYGMVEVDRAEANGYGIGERFQRAARAPQRDPNREYLATLTPAEQARYTAAMFGDGTDVVAVPVADGSTVTTSRSGCLSDARRTLFGADFDRWVELDVWVTNVDQEIIPKVLESDRYRRALSAWQACMDRRGHPAADPAAARAAAAARYDSVEYDRAWEVEQRMAVADARCVGESRIAAVAEELHQTFADRIAAQREEDVADYHRRRAAAIGQARMLLAAYGDDTVNVEQEEK